MSAEQVIKDALVKAGFVLVPVEALRTVMDAAWLAQARLGHAAECCCFRCSDVAQLRACLDYASV